MRETAFLSKCAAIRKPVAKQVCMKSCPPPQSGGRDGGRTDGRRAAGGRGRGGQTDEQTGGWANRWMIRYVVVGLGPRRHIC